MTDDLQSGNHSLQIEMDCLQTVLKSLHTELNSLQTRMNSSPEQTIWKVVYFLQSGKLRLESVVRSRSQAVCK